ncbi:hypothetical protein P3T76_008570 [Phytophthora citrophthora]|uniref:Uncharacterized protein n=1 Tax=Phytophthora citrophthora TaxID=4793 RepID=A0AAD9LK18_9STRA|nr:hypothetical protein P3T76_008570 [Phytophthora citrophthora]
MMIMYRLELKLLRFTDLNTLRKVNMDPQVSDPIDEDTPFSKHQTHPTALLPGTIQVTRFTNTFGFQGVYANQFAL